jgi:chromosome segregation ATPase
MHPPGKSTLLQAILFGLGDKATNLRGKANADLATAPILEVISVGSSVCQATGERTYRHQGHKIPRNRFDDAVRALGVNIDSPFWHIRQNGVQSILAAPPQSLHDMLCEVAGTKTINTQRAAAVKQLSSWRASLVNVQAAVSSAESAVAEEAAQLRLLDR